MTTTHLPPIYQGSKVPIPKIPTNFEPSTADRSSNPSLPTVRVASPASLSLMEAIRQKEVAKALKIVKTLQVIDGLINLLVEQMAWARFFSDNLNRSIAGERWKKYTPFLIQHQKEKLEKIKGDIAKTQARVERITARVKGFAPTLKLYDLAEFHAEQVKILEEEINFFKIKTQTTLKEIDKKMVTFTDKWAEYQKEKAIKAEIARARALGTRNVPLRKVVERSLESGKTPKNKAIDTSAEVRKAARHRFLENSGRAQQKA